MTQSAKPLWPDPMGLPFGLFGASPPAAAEPAAPPPMGQALLQPFVQGLAGGAELVKNFWGSLPGGTAVPGFLVPTLDVEELDKRIADLKAAEQWVDVNLNMLRATIQGLEVQRHTIAAIQSLGAMAESPRAEKASATPSGLPPGWPVSRKAAPAPAPAVRPEPESEPPDEPEEVEAPAPRPRPARKSKARKGKAASASTAKSGAAADPLTGLAAGNWLGYMQDQFTKVAQAALANGPAATGAGKAAKSTPSTPPSPPAKAARRKTSKARRKASPARKAAAPG